MSNRLIFTGIEFLKSNSGFFRTHHYKSHGDQYYNFYIWRFRFLLQICEVEK